MASQELQVARVAVVEVEGTNPIEKLGFYQKEVMSHLDGTQEQLKRLASVRVNALRSKVPGACEHSFGFEDREQNLRGNLAQKIQDMRASFENLALVIAEILRLREAGEVDLISECYEELKRTTASIQADFSSQQSFFIDTLRRQTTNSMIHSKEADSASLAKWACGCMAATTGAVGLVTWVPLLGDLQAGPRSGEIAKGIVGALMDWVTRWIFNSKPESAFPRSAIVFYPIVPVSMAVGFAGSFRGFLQSRALQREHLELSGREGANTAFVRANEEMWMGMNQLVSALCQTVEDFQKLNKQRADRVSVTLKAIVQKTFNMVMSVDVYMVWLERHSVFPPNVSVSVIMGKTTYQAIYSMLNPHRRWFSFGAPKS